MGGGTRTICGVSVRLLERNFRARIQLPAEPALRLFINLKPGGERNFVVDESECQVRPLKASEREGNVKRLRIFRMVRAQVRTASRS